MAADSDTLDGWGGTLALVDELGRHKSEENFGLLRDGLGSRDGQLVAFSTAGDDEDSALGRIRSRAHEMPGFGVSPDNPKHKIGRAEGFAFHEWSLDRGDDTDDLQLAALANPSSWFDVEALCARKASPSMQEWQWKRFTCGLWVAGEDSALSATDLAACADPDAVIPAGAYGVVIGGDLGFESTARRLFRPGARPLTTLSSSGSRSSSAHRVPVRLSRSRTWSRPVFPSPAATPPAPSASIPRPAASSYSSGLSASSPTPTSSSSSRR
jgi:hypothetical protein